MLRTIFIFTILLAAVTTGIFSRFAALLGYVWFALFRPQEFLWFDISAFRPSLLLCLLLVIPSLLTRILPDVKHGLSRAMLAFVLVAALSHFTAVDAALSAGWLQYMATQVAVCLLAVTLVNTEKRFAVFAVVIAASFGFYPAKAGLASLLVGGATYSEGIGGAFSDNNGYAVGTVMIIPLLLLASQLLRRETECYRWLFPAFLVAIPLSMFTVFSTLSRGGLLGLVGSVICYILLQRRRLIALPVAVVLGTLVFLVAPLPRGYDERVQTIGASSEGENASVTSRLHFWRVAWQMAKDRPLGVGLRNYESAYSRYDSLEGLYGQNRSVHSSHLQVLAELGFPGFAVWVWLFFLALRSAFRIRSRAAAPGLTPDEQRANLCIGNTLIASMTGFLIAGSFYALALNDITWFTFATVAAADRVTAARVQASASSEAGRCSS